MLGLQVFSNRPVLCSTGDQVQGFAHTVFMHLKKSPGCHALRLPSLQVGCLGDPSFPSVVLRHSSMTESITEEKVNFSLQFQLAIFHRGEVKVTGTQNN